jgi:hypothetical protein
MSDQMNRANGARHPRLAAVDAAIAADAADAADVTSRNVPKCPIGASADATSDAQPLAGLSDTQLKAVELLIGGTSITRTAQECGVDRRTVYRWRHEDGPFRAELQRRRQELWSIAADRMRSMVLTSLTIFNDALQEEWADARFQAATKLLRVVNLRKLVEADMAKREE